MYSEIEAIPADDNNVTDQMIAVITNHVSEVWSPPRVTKLAHEYGQSPGFEYDIPTCDAPRKHWDLDPPEQREQCLRDVMTQKPQFLIGSPMCTAFSVVRGLKKLRMSPAKWTTLMQEGWRHMRFAIKSYRRCTVCNQSKADGSFTSIPTQHRRGRCRKYNR